MNVTMGDVIRACTAAFGNNAGYEPGRYAAMRKALESYVKHHGLTEVRVIPQAEGVAGK